MAINEQRTEDYRAGSHKLAGGLSTPEEITDETPWFIRDYSDFYKTPIGYHPRSVGGNGGWNVSGCISFLNQPILKYANEIRSAVLMVHGERAHSRYFSEDAYAAMLDGNAYTDNKELLIVADAVHTDLYYKMDVIPFDRIQAFFERYLQA